MRLLACSVLMVFLTPAWAATPYKQSLSNKKNQYAADGVFVGGKAGGGTSLLNVHRVFSAKQQIERVTLDLGDKDAKPAGRDIGFFQVSVDSKENRVVIDLSQLKLSRVSEAAVQNLFKKSAYVASVGLTLDPEDKAGTMVLNLKRPVKVEVFKQIKDNSPGKIVMDITPRS